VGKPRTVNLVKITLARWGNIL